MTPHTTAFAREGDQIKVLFCLCPTQTCPAARPFLTAFSPQWRVARCRVPAHASTDMLAGLEIRKPAFTQSACSSTQQAILTAETTLGQCDAHGHNVGLI